MWDVHTFACDAQPRTTCTGSPGTGKSAVITQVQEEMKQWEKTRATKLKNNNNNRHVGCRCQIVSARALFTDTPAPSLLPFSSPYPPSHSHSRTSSSSQCLYINCMELRNPAAIYRVLATRLKDVPTKKRDLLEEECVELADAIEKYFTSALSSSATKRQMT